MTKKITKKDGKIVEYSPKEKLVKKLKDTLKAIEKQPDDLDVSCMIIQVQNDDYAVDIRQYL